MTLPAAATTGKSAIDPDLYDLARVEVLGGPQENTYGAGSLGGTVKLVRCYRFLLRSVLISQHLGVAGCRMEPFHSVGSPDSFPSG
jgi:hypothetical protein